MRRSAALLLVGVSACSKCDSATTAPLEASTPTSAAATTTATTPATYPPSARSAWSIAGRRAMVPCRAISVSAPVAAGDLDAGVAIASDQEIPMGAWIELGAGGKFTAKDPKTTRETSFEGPGRVRPCVRGEEQSWIAMGKFASVMGAGETPGAEEWVITPMAVVRYASAKLEVNVAADRATVTLRGGAGFVWFPEGVPRPAAKHDDVLKDQPLILEANDWYRLPTGSPVEAREPEPKKTKERAAALLAACEAAAQKARDLAQKIAAPGADLSDLAPKHVVARLSARAACAVAQLRGEGSASLVERALEADELWRSLASPP